MTNLAQIRAAYERDDFTETLRLSSATLDETATSRERASVLSLRAQALYSLGHFSEAASARQQEIEQLIASKATEESVATVRHGRAWALYRARQFEESLQEAARVYLERETSLGAEHAKTLGGLQLCVYNLEALQQYEQTVPLARELYERRKVVFGADADETVDAKQRLERAESALSSPVTSSAGRTATASANATFNVSSGSSEKPRSRALEVTAAIIGQTARLSVRGLVEAILD